MFDLMTVDTVALGVTDIFCELATNKAIERSYNKTITKHKITNNINAKVRLDVEHKEFQFSLNYRAYKAHK